MNFVIKIFIFSILISSSVLGEIDYELSGHLKLKASYIDFEKGSVADISGQEKGSLQDYNFRLRSFVSYDSSSIRAEADINGVGGSSKSATESVLIGRPLLENDNRRLMNLSTEEGDQDFSRTSRFDRLFYRYQTSDFDIKIGRQAFSFGNGLAFSVLDVFNPFSPVAFDREYKIGEDIASLNFQWSPELNLTLLTVGRRDDQNNINNQTNSYGAFLVYEGEGIGFSSVIAEHYGNAFFGTGFSKEIFAAVMRIDISRYQTENAEKTDFLINLDKGFVIFEKNTYFFLEYFKSGLGKSNYENVGGLLAERIARGELYTLGKNYIAVGNKVELTDRASLINAIIMNLDDQSTLLRPYLEVEPNNYSRIRCGLILPTGSSGSEYGGFNLKVPQSQQTAEISQGTQAFLQYALYF